MKDKKDFLKVLSQVTGITSPYLDELFDLFEKASDKDKERIYKHIAWHIPTGGSRMVVGSKILKKDEVLADLKSFMDGIEVVDPTPDDTEISTEDLLNQLKGGETTLKNKTKEELEETVTPENNLTLTLDNSKIATKSDIPVLTINSDISVTIDGDGTLESPYNGGAETNETATATIITEGNLEINGDVHLIGPRCVWTKNSDSEVTIKGGEFETMYATNPVVYIGKEGGHVTIEGGEFKTVYEGKIYSGNKFLLNLNDKSNGSITVKGGKFYNFDPSHSKSENPEKDFVAPGYIVGWYEDPDTDKYAPKQERKVYIVEKYNNHPDTDIDDVVTTWDIDGYKKRSGIIDADKNTGGSTLTEPDDVDFDLGAKKETKKTRKSTLEVK